MAAAPRQGSRGLDFQVSAFGRAMGTYRVFWFDPLPQGYFWISSVSPQSYLYHPADWHGSPQGRESREAIEVRFLPFMKEHQVVTMLELCDVCMCFCVCVRTSAHTHAHFTAKDIFLFMLPGAQLQSV